MCIDLELIVMYIYFFKDRYVYTFYIDRCVYEFVIDRCVYRCVINRYVYRFGNIVMFAMYGLCI